MNISSPFARNYEIERIHHRIDKSFRFRTFRYPGGTPIGEENQEGAVSFLITPHHAKPWIAVFSARECFSGPRSATAYNCANPREICVVVNGQGFIIDSQSPRTWVTIPCFPVCDVTPVAEHQLLIFSDFSMLAALSKTGLAWTVRALSADGLVIDNWDEQFINVRTRETNGALTFIPFQIDAKTGQCTGSACVLGRTMPNTNREREIHNHWFGQEITANNLQKLQANT